MTDQEKEILKASKEFARAHKLHYDMHTENMILNAIREVNQSKPTDEQIVQRVSADGVFFKCSKCDYKPEMGSDTDDLISMNYCPDCGCKFSTPQQEKEFKKCDMCMEPIDNSGARCLDCLLISVTDKPKES